MMRAHASMIVMHLLITIKRKQLPVFRLILVFRISTPLNMYHTTGCFSWPIVVPSKSWKELQPLSLV